MTKLSNSHDKHSSLSTEHLNGHRTTTKVLVGVVLLLLVTGMLHRWVRSSRNVAMSILRPIPISLSSLPSRLGSYTKAYDLPLSEEILQVADVDSYINRSYVYPNMYQSIGLYVGYWGHQNRGLGHGPEVCYPAVGWTNDSPMKQHKLQFSGFNDTSIDAEMAIHHFIRTDPLEIKKQAVGFIAVVGGQFIPTSRGEFLHRPPDSRNEGFVAHIIVSTSLSGTDWVAADARITDFMNELLPHVSKCLFEDSQNTNAGDPETN